MYTCIYYTSITSLSNALQMVLTYMYLAICFWETTVSLQHVYDILIIMYMNTFSIILLFCYHFTVTLL